MRCFCLVSALIYINYCVGQVRHSSPSANYVEIGAYSLNFTDVFSFTGNQASLSRVKTMAVAVYSERKYMLEELQRFSAVASFPFMKGGAGISAGYFGFATYNESHAGIAYGRSLGEKIDLGIQFNYHHIGMAGYGSAGTINFEIGSIIHLTKKLHIGCHLYNPVGGRFGRDPGEKLTSQYSFGTGYEASEKLFLTASLVKEENQPVTINASIHYAFVKQFFIRGGITSASAGYFAGAGLLWKNCRLDIAVYRHPQAGLTPGLLLVFMFPQSKVTQE